MDTSRIESGYWYHSIALPRGDGTTAITPGEYDHRPYLERYGFPSRMSGMSVLDVGPADGFFSFEFERRGATRVVAVDRDTYPDVPFHEVERFGQGVEHGRNRLLLARDLLRSSVDYRLGDVYELSAEEFGTFDLVFCGSLLLHLTDPIRALQGLRRVTGDRLVLATAYYHEPAIGLYERAIRTAMRLRGRKTDVTFAALVRTVMDDTFWLPTKAALLDLVTRTGFRDARIVSTFRLDRRDGRRGWPHAVVHARV